MQVTSLKNKNKVYVLTENLNIYYNTSCKVVRYQQMLTLVLLLMIKLYISDTESSWTNRVCCIIHNGCVWIDSVPKCSCDISRAALNHAI